MKGWTKAKLRWKPGSTWVIKAGFEYGTPGPCPTAA